MSRLRMAFLGVLAATALLMALAGSFVVGPGWGDATVAGVAFLPLAVLAMIGWMRIERNHGDDRLGLANAITIFRLGLAGLMLGTAADLATNQSTMPPGAAWMVTAFAAAALILDGADGWIARRRGFESAFGARLDMETDALLILVLSVLAWLLGKAGFWVVLLGVLRYLFWAAGFVFTRMAVPLPPSFRRKAACVAAGVVLAVLMAPVVVPPVTTGLAAVALAVLAYSFAVDTLWLLRTPRRARQT